MSEDTISRKAAIDICNNAIDLWHGQLGEGIVIAVKKKIKDLPSAQPDSKETSSTHKALNPSKGKVRPYDSLWDMYLDEFEDYCGERV